MGRRPKEQGQWEQGRWAQRYRPKGDLWAGAWAAWLAFTTPVFASLYLLTIPDARWAPFALAHVLLMALFAAVAGRLRGAGILLSAEGIREREYLGALKFTPADNVAAVLVVEVRDSYTDKVMPQYFVIDRAGSTVLRLRGQLWHPADVQAMVQFYGVPVRVTTSDMTWPELRRAHGANLDRWERHPIITTVLAVIVFLVVAIPILLATMAGIG
jgi:hypothetical protein